MSKRILSLSTGAFAFLVALGLASAVQAGPTTVCGDGVQEGAELCDDGNTVGGDGCSAGCLPEVCGDGVLEPDTEECDDSNTTANDGCSATCTNECGDGTICGDGNPASCIPPYAEECDPPNPGGGNGVGCDDQCIIELCGNGVLQPTNNETCDDGNTTAGDGCDATCIIETAEQTKGQQKCINALNKDDAKVKSTQNKEHVKCLKDASKGKVADFDACLTADSKGKVAKAQAKTCTNETKKCTEAPTFAATDCATVNMAAQDASLALAADIYGSPAPAPADAKAAKDDAKCQGDIAKNATKVMDTVMKEANKAKKSALKGSKSVPAVGNSVELSTAINAALGTSSKVAKATDKLASGATKKCGASTIATLYPSSGCPTDTLVNFVACVGRQAVCRAVENLNTADGLTLDPSVVAGGTCL